MPMKDPKISKLRRLLTSIDRHERACAAIELGKNGEPRLLEEIKPLTTDPDDLVAIAAIYGCWKLGAEPIDLERIVAGLASKEEEVMQEAVEALCDIGSLAVPGLKKMLSDDSPFSTEILEILGDIGGDESYAVVSEFQSDDPELQAVAKEVLEDWE